MEFHKLAIAGIAMTLAVAGGLVAHAEPLIIAYPVWVGYGPLFVAQEKSFFADQGAEVNMIRVENVGMERLLMIRPTPWPRRSTSFARVSTPDDAAIWIVATEQIQGIADLEGKTIALSSPASASSTSTSCLRT